MRKKFVLFSAVIICSVFIICSLTVARADTLLFPVIAVNSPNVTTIISVMNEAATSSASYMHYIYRVKDSIVSNAPNITGGCTSVAFTRPTYYHDLVSFDASGIMNGGNALFGDTDPYGGGFGIGLTGAKRAYLLVSHSNSTGARVDVASPSLLVGEAIIMDIMYGAAWGYKAINDTVRQDYTFDIANLSGAAMQYGANNYRGFNFFPMNEWTTRFFVTPVGSDMDSANLEGIVRLSTSLHVLNRTGSEFIFTPPEISPKCTAAIDLQDLMDSTTKSAVETTGGYSRFCVQSGGTQPENPVIGYKLEYVVNNPTYGGTNNSGYLFTNTWAMP